MEKPWSGFVGLVGIPYARAFSPLRPDWRRSFRFSLRIADSHIAPLCRRSSGSVTVHFIGNVSAVFYSASPIHFTLIAALVPAHLNSINFHQKTFELRPLAIHSNFVQWPCRTRRNSLFSVLVHDLTFAGTEQRRFSLSSLVCTQCECAIRPIRAF